MKKIVTRLLADAHCRVFICISSSDFLRCQERILKLRLVSLMQSIVKLSLKMELEDF